MAVTMWEVRAAEGRLADLVAWVLERVAPDVAVYRGVTGADRVVVIDPAGRAARTLADPPAELVARPPHAWDFLPARNT